MSIKEALFEITKSNDKFKFYLEHMLSGEATDIDIEVRVLPVGVVAQLSRHIGEATQHGAEAARDLTPKSRNS